MSLPPLVELDEFEVVVGSPPDVGKAEALLRRVSALVRSYTDRTWADGDAPEDVRAVVLEVASRVWSNPKNLGQTSTGPFSGSYKFVGIYLLDEEKAILARYRANQRGIWTMSVTRGDASDTVYVPVQGSEPFPLYAGDDL